MKNFFSLTEAELAATPELGAWAARRLYHWFYKLKRSDWPVADISRSAQRWCEEHLSFERVRIHETIVSPDRTVKFVVALADGKRVESVLLPFQGKYSLCLSSQVGCAMKCSFCYTGQAGLTRHLEAHEIVTQFLVAHDWLREHRPAEARLLNVVFMGQGEPLHNFDAVKRACEILLSRSGLCLADHKITVSTAGLLPGIERFKAEMPSVNLALSLHAVDDEIRSELIPLNKTYPLRSMIDLLDSIPQGKKRFVTYEYLLIEGLNDSDAQALALAEFLRGRKALVSLIPYNPIPGVAYQRPSLERVERFRQILDERKVVAFIRGTKGDSILAACGQLHTEKRMVRR